MCQYKGKQRGMTVKQKMEKKEGEDNRWSLLFFILGIGILSNISDTYI